MSDDRARSAEALAAELAQARQRIEALERQAARTHLLDELIAGLPDGFTLVDAQGVPLEVNEALCEMTGLTRDRLIGASLPFPYWPPEEIAANTEAFLACMRGEIRTLELTFMRRDGERFPVLVTPTIVRAADGTMQVGMATFKDVSRLRHAEQALAASETDFRALVENTREVFARYDLDLRFTYVSPVISHWLPLEPEAMIGRTNLEAGFPPELAGLFDDTLRRTLETLAPAAIEYRVSGREGELTAESRVYPLLAEDGRATALMSISRDVTDRVRTEDALRESEGKYRAVVERAGDAVLIVDAERCLFGNAMAAHISGYAVGELEGLPISAVVPEATRAQLLDRGRQLLAGEEVPGTHVADLVRKDGSLFTAEISAGLISYGGAPASLLLVRDVTAREQAVVALRRSEAMRDITEAAAHVGSYRWDLVTGDATYTPEMYRLFDIDPETFDGDLKEVIRTRVHPDDRAGLLHQIREFHESGREGTATYRVVHRDGTVHELLGETHLEHRDDGVPSAVVGYYQDISERVRAEEQIRRLNAELEERVASRTAQRDALNRELEAFAYSVAHDVRAPLRAIKGFSAAVLDDARERLTPEDVALLERVRGASRRMGALIDDLLGLSRVSRQELLRSAVDVSALAAEVAAELRAEEPARQVELSVAPGMTAVADQVLLRIILRELLANAWKFTAGRDPAHVEVGRAGGDDTETAFFVSDDGAGYDARFAGHLFGAFQRLHPSADYPGNGIGLATVQRLVARHGGSVWADGRPGKGATFWFTLPDEGGRRPPGPPA